MRCDRKSPCVTCERRGHVNLCGLEAPSQLALPDVQPMDSVPTPGQAEDTRNYSQPSFTAPESPRDTAPAIGRRDTTRLIELLDHVSSRLEPSHETDNKTREKIYLGQNCAANFFRILIEYASERPQLPPGVSIESAFGLSNRTTLHPFRSLWSHAGDVSLRNILQSLPAVEVCLR